MPVYYDHIRKLFLKLSAMKSILLLIGTFAMWASAFSQRLSGYAALGLGTSLEKNIEGCSEQNRARYIGSMSAYYRVNGRISIGAEAMGSGPLNIFGKSACDLNDPNDNSLKLSPSNLKSGTVLLHGKMLLMSYKEMEPYVDMGIGFNTYRYADPVKDAGSIKKTTFVMAPELGINIYKFQFACKVIIGGKTPQFNGTDPEQQNRVVKLESIKAQQVYLTIGYQLFRL